MTVILRATNKQSYSHLIHDWIFKDDSQSICSRAYQRQDNDWRWAVFRKVMDWAFSRWEKDHCFLCFQYYHDEE